jgi:hypothetical protein
LIHEAKKETKKRKTDSRSLQNLQRQGIVDSWQIVKDLPEEDKRKRFVLNSRDHYEREYQTSLLLD